MNQAVLDLPDPTKKSPKDRTESYVITGHLVAALRGQDEFRTTDHATFLREGRGRGSEAECNAVGGGTGRDPRECPHLSCTPSTAGEKDGGMDDGADAHSQRDGTGCAGMARYPLPEIWPRAPTHTQILRRLQ